MFVRDVVIATPWVIALEVIGKSASILEGRRIKSVLGYWRYKFSQKVIT